MELPEFKYKFDHGPVSESRLKGNIERGNCRLAVQVYFYNAHNLFLEPNQVLCPQSYKYTGKFIYKKRNKAAWDIGALKIGDIIYAEKLKNKNSEIIHKPEESFTDHDEWIISLHSAIYIGGLKVWHATIIEGRTRYWPIEKFSFYYLPVAVKRIVDYYTV